MKEMPANELIAQPIRNRIEVLDIIRACALFGIYISIVHSFSNSYAEIPDEMRPNEGQLDRTLNLLGGIFISKRFIGMLSLLFGIGIAIQEKNFQKIGRPFGGYFTKRMLVLAGFGLINTTFLFNAEILLVYAVFGMICFALSKLGQITLMLVAVIAYFVWGEFFEIVFRDKYITWFSWFTETYPYTRVEEIYARGSLWEMIHLRWIEYAYIYTDNGYHLGTSLGLIIAGYLIGKKERYLNFISNLPKYRKWFLICLIFTLLFGGYQFVTFNSWFFSRETPILFVVYNLYLPASMFTYLYLITLICNSVDKSNWLLRGLVRNGRVSLTGYMGGAFAFSLIFYNTGWGLFNQYGSATRHGIAILLYIAFTVFATAWLKKFERGPMEWLFRRVVYGRLKK